MLRVSQSVVGRREADAVARVLCEDGYLGMGAEVQAFEKELSEFLGVPGDQIICVNSGTAALHLAVEAVARPGQEVLVQSLTFVASLQAITAAGAKPVLCEINPENVTIDLGDAERRLTAKTCAIMPVHYASFPGDLEAIYAFAEQHGLRVIEDAAHAFGGRHKGNLIGSFGDIVCFSFDGIKNITSGEGGAIVSADHAVLDYARDARLLGIRNDTRQRFANARSWEFDVTHQGYRFHMSNINAAIGRVQLDRLKNGFSKRRVALARRYRRQLKDMAGLALLETNLDEVVPHIQPVRILNGQRDAVKDLLAKAGIETGIHYRPGHLLTFFSQEGGEMPVTNTIYEELLTLPLHAGMEEQDADRVCAEIASSLKCLPER